MGGRTNERINRIPKNIFASENTIFSKLFQWIEEHPFQKKQEEEETGITEMEY